tara:strand:- start:751 stop:1269 length:519 start_codon:yes stop_codon:yes gene_type:complete
MSIKLYTDKTEVFECNVALEGVSIKESKLRAILKFDDKNLMVEGKIKSNGKGEIIFPKLKNISEDGQVGKMQLEVIAEDAYFQPYEETFQVVTSKKAKVEIFSKTTSKPKIVVEKITPAMSLMMLLKENGITKKELVKNKSRFSKVLYNYYIEANIQESFNVFLSKVIKRLD